MNHVLKTGLVVFFLIFTAGCATKQLAKHYYLLDAGAGAEDSLRFSTPLSFSVQIAPFDINPAFNQNRIALRTRSHELRYFYYHLWAERPAIAVRYFVFDQFERYRLFTDCTLQIGARAPDYFVTGYIDQIERLENNERSAARLKMTFELIQTQQNKKIVVHRFNRTVPFKKNGAMNLFAAALSKALDQEVRIFAKKIYDTLR